MLVATCQEALSELTAACFFSRMLKLTLLGTVQLRRDDAAESAAVVAQPKPLALLAITSFSSVLR